jgi:hypothetical protein
MTSFASMVVAQEMNSFDPTEVLAVRVPIRRDDSRFHSLSQPAAVNR